MTGTRQRAHQLIDQLSDMQLSGLVQFLESIVDPVNLALINAPLDDEPETPEEKLAGAEATAWLQKNGGKGIPHRDAMRSINLE